mmetsp:Transcript_14849/g.27361  ORF Transcript_14849/g.27361 Transcript_14849/m.27361 type:complete len:85 (-) Transcript_14849:2049-2303(-)
MLQNFGNVHSDGEFRVIQSHAGESGTKFISRRTMAVVVVVCWCAVMVVVCILSSFCAAVVMVNPLRGANQPPRPVRWLVRAVQV